MADIVYLHGEPSPIVRFLRVSKHRKLEHLALTDGLPYDRFIVDAGSFDEQRDLVELLRQKGHQLILDTNIAELSAPGRFDGQARHAPWAVQGNVLTEAQLTRGSNEGIIGSIARFAISKGFSRVLAPSHFISGTQDRWFKIDLDNCSALRKALDLEGGGSIQIDYPLMLPYGSLIDASQRRDLIVKMGSLAADGISMRVSGFGADATAAGIGKYIAAVQAFHFLGKPIIADSVGGLTALGIVAFGAASAVSFGVACKERFDASTWYKPRPKGGGGGGGYSFLIPGIDGLLKHEDAEAIIRSSGGRRLASCNDPQCCPLGFEDTIKNPERHFLRQRAIKFDTLSSVPDLARTKHFVENDFAQDERIARQLAKLKCTDEGPSPKLVKNASRLGRIGEMLKTLEKTNASATRSLAFPSIINKDQAKRERP
jgi:hypothetical protein